MMKLLIVLAAFAFISVNAQHHCSAPHELTFRASRTTWDEKFYTRFFGQYDRFNERIVFVEETHVGQQKHHHKFLFLHHERTGYDLNLVTRQCKRFQIGEFRPFEVPYNASFEGQYSVGGPEEGIFVNRWSDKLPTRRETYMAEFSHRTCYPISSFLVENGDFRKTVLTHYYDSVLGIVNPNDFIVPYECHKAEKQDTVHMAARLAKSMTSGSLHH